MTSELHATVPKITATQSRIDAVVVLGATRYGVTLDPRKQQTAEVAAALDTLCEVLIKTVKADIAEHLEDDLSASSRRALIR